MTGLEIARKSYVDKEIAIVTVLLVLLNQPTEHIVHLVLVPSFHIREKMGSFIA